MTATRTDHPTRADTEANTVAPPARAHGESTLPELHTTRRETGIRARADAELRAAATGSWLRYRRARYERVGLTLPGPATDLYADLRTEGHRGWTLRDGSTVRIGDLVWLTTDTGEAATAHIQSCDDRGRPAVRFADGDLAAVDPAAILIPEPTGPSRPRIGRRVAMTVAAVAMTLGCTGGGPGSPPHPTPAGGHATVGGAMTVTPAADPVVYTSATVNYVHYQTWTMDPASGGGPPVLTTYDVQLWWHPDGTALTKRCARSEPADRDRIADPDPETGPCPDTTHYATGSFYPGLADPPSTDPDVLRRQLTAYNSGTGDQYTVRAVADLHRYHRLNPRQRAAALLVLADLPTIKPHGEAIDRAGRTGQAFSVEAGATNTGRTRDLIIFDSDTGALLYYERGALTPKPGEPIKPMSVLEYAVYLDARMVTAIPGTPPLACDETPCAR